MFALFKVIYMNEIVITSICTAILGFFAFLFSQVYFKSIERYKELKARTIHALVYYANVFHNPIDLADMPDHKSPIKHDEASDNLRKLAADWRALIELKVSPGFFVPKNIKLQDVSHKLIGLANGMTYAYNSKDTNLIRDNTTLDAEIKKLLKIYNGN